MATASKKKSKRIFVLDPVCAQVKGHNLTSLGLFIRYFAELFPDANVTGHVSRLLDPAIADAEGVSSDFDFYYFNHLQVSDHRDQPYQSDEPFAEDHQPARALADIVAFFETHDLSGSDTLFLPSADFYTTQAILKHLESVPPKSAPRVFFRFIHVMEYASSLYHAPINILIDAIKRSQQSGQSVSVAAESSVYATFLAERLGCPVNVTPVPMTQSLLPIPDDGAFVVLCPGSGRADKGFNELPHIIGNFRRQFPERDVRFVIQNVPNAEFAICQGAASQLYAMPGADLLPTSIDAEQMQALFASCHLVMMPYQQHIYERRSSAILTEAIGYGRPVLSSKGTGFEDDIRYFKAGRICAGQDDYVAAIADISEQAPTVIERRAEQARQRYRTLCDAEYRDWMS